MIRIFRIVFTILLALTVTDATAWAQRNRANVRNSSRTSVSRQKSTSVRSNRDIDVNRRTER